MQEETELQASQPFAAAEPDAQAAALQTLLDQSPVTMFSVDRDLRYTAFNSKHARGMRALFGCEISRGSRFLDFITYPIDRDLAERNLLRALAGEQFVMTAHLGWPGGFELDVTLLHIPIHDKLGDVVGVSVLSEEVENTAQADERVRVYEGHLQAAVRQRTSELSESETQYRELFQNMSTVFLVVDPQNGAILDANRAACDFYGYTYSQLTGQTVSDLSVSPSDFIQSTLAKFNTGEISHLNATHRLANGETREMDIYAGPLTFHGRAVLITTLHDVTAVRRAERARQESEANFRILFHTLPLHGIIFRLVNSAAGEVVDFSVEDINDFGAAAFGEAARELKGRRASQLYPAALMDKYLPICREVKASGRWRMYETKSPDGNYYYLSTVFMLSSDLYTMINLDISEQKHNEAQLRESEERYRLLFENCLEALLIVGLDGTIQSANPAATRMLGWTAGEFQQLKRSQIFDQDNPLLPQVRQDYRLKHRYEGELTMVRKDGTHFPAEISASPFTGWDGQQRIGIFIYDLSERREAEDQLRDIQSHYHLLFEYSPGAILIADPQNMGILSANRAAEQLFGRSVEELRKVGRTGVADLGDPRNYAALEELRQNGRFTGELGFRRKDGSVFDARTSVLYDNSSGRTLSIVIFHSISEAQPPKTRRKTKK